MTPLPKPPKRQPKPRRPIARSAKPIARKARVPKVSQSPAAVARRKADAAWSDFTRFAATGRCEYCWCEGTDSHHVYGRKAHPQLRHSVVNGVYLCRAHHNYAHRSPVEFRVWFARQNPDSWARLQRLLLGAK